MEEYEYSFEVKSIEPYIEYCKINNYLNKGISTQNRIVYENRYSEDIIARITTNIVDGKKVTLFDCKNVGKRNNELKISNETMPLKVTRYNKKQIYSILDVLCFYEKSNLFRTRYIYEKDGVKFEIDDYKIPDMKVVAVEGIRDKVDSVYKEIENFKDRM